MEREESQQELLDELAVLRAESVDRHQQLRSIIADLPAATSRRAVVSKMLGSVADAPDRRTVVRRVAAKVARTPGELIEKRRAR